MTTERFYSLLLRIYPASFREEYRDAMCEAFRALREAHIGSPLAFWRFVIADLIGSAVTAHVDAFRSGVRRFLLEWVAACACGAVATALVANLMTFGFSYFYHPYLEGIALPPWSYGALLGVALGGSQMLVLRRRFPLNAGWVAASGIGTAIGLQSATALARVAGPIAYGLVLGCTVGAVQWLALRARLTGAVWAVAGSGIALSIVMLSRRAILPATFDGLNPLAAGAGTAEQLPYGAAIDFLARGLYGPTTGGDFRIELAVMVTCGLAVAALTATPLAAIYARQSRS